MKDQYFVFSDKTKKIRSKYIILSGVSLFIGLTEALPKKFSLIGLDLSNNQEVLGWFIFFINLILLFNFVVVASLELIEHYLPLLIKKETYETTGDTLGLNIEECIQHQASNDGEGDRIGTPEQELKDISGKNTTIADNYKNLYVKIHDITVLIFEYIFPVVFSLFGMYFILNFLLSSQCINN